MRRLAVAMLVMCACAVLVGCGTAVPDARGMSLAQATKTIGFAGFKTGAVSYDDKSTAATGSVIAQMPKAGERAKDGSPVALTIAGPPPVQVPDLLGMDKSKAEAALGAAGLALGQVTESYDSSSPVGEISTQAPSPTVLLERGLAVAVVISKGPEPVAVPNVVGATKVGAQKTLQAAGFTVAAVSKDDRATKGTVLAQAPAAGKAVVPGIKVTLTVSTGIDMVKVPSWRSFKGSYTGTDWGKTLESMETAIKAGFNRVGLIADVEFLNAWVDGETAHQSPKAGSRARRGTRVHIQIPVYD
jgi:beta-lactam-binding protein with PASTA domain